MNLTLSIDDHLVERAREVARQQGTSLNALIRDYLQSLTAPPRGSDLAEKSTSSGPNGAATPAAGAWTARSCTRSGSTAGLASPVAERVFVDAGVFDFEG